MATKKAQKSTKMTERVGKIKVKDGRNMLGKSREEAGIPALGSKIILPPNYQTILAEIKSRIQTERIRVALSANAAMILLYWDIGNGILEQQKQQGWGAKVIDRLSFDLKEAFPDMGGLTPRNLLFMRSFAESFASREIVKQLVSQIPWGHILRVIQKLKDSSVRLWYIQKTIENGWSRNVLVMQIESQLHLRQEKAATNFEVTMPPEDSDMAKQIFNSPIGVAEWKTSLVESLPDDLQGSLPSIEDIEAELSKGVLENGNV